MRYQILSLPDALPAHDSSKLGFVYITVLGLANQVVPHTGSWHSWATSANYLVMIAFIVYMVFQARPASPVGVQSDTGMGCEMVIDNLLPLKTQAQGRDLNPEPKFLQAAGPMD
ncbi:hypothetical protein DSO57_1020854 [Entomophthora muscae]|uniref:Uncharacterized protein n=1 Tax=Entomophthora muscae TaxID=34485 RepID=A0ACC2UQN9_9FUNG|nr:hypothetical protein DSO57_1020854 [Entomophthora muscae]